MLYSPFNDLTKMWYSSDYILFRVSINEKEYLGRVFKLQIENFQNEKPLRALFRVYKTIEDYKNNIIQDDIEITPTEIIGLEAIDTKSDKSPTPLSQILFYCNELEQTSNTSDVGIIRRDIPTILDKLLNAAKEFSKEHSLAYISNVTFFIEENIKDAKSIPLSSTESERIKFISKMKEEISHHINVFIVIPEEDKE